ncbi:MAG: WG repeat-containing protein [Rikenellaceae bacterium]|jgi:hypothetical protein|nr:WG repeat-containing protein [Rikenellaceae bacterium]
MKHPTIANCLETLGNPLGRFRTLTSIRLLPDREGNPVYRINSNKTVGFQVEHAGERYLLLICLADNDSRLNEALRVAAYLRGVRPPCLLPLHVLPDEMLVFGDDGQPRQCDVLLIGYPAGQTLGTRIAKACAIADRKTLRRLHLLFTAMATEVIGRGNFVHGNICPAQILVTDDGECCLRPHREIKVPGTDSWHEVQSGDHLPVASLALVLYLLSHHPEMYARYGGKAIFSRSRIRTLAALLLNNGGNCGNAPLTDLMTLVCGAGGGSTDAGRLCMLLRAVAECELPVIYTFLPDEVPAPAGQEVSKTSPTASFGSVGDFHESLAAVSHHGKWGYIRPSGKVAIPLRYDWAGDFEEGLAIVMGNKCFGLIDKAGREVVPTICEDLSWVADNGVILVSLEGKWHFLDRDGQPVGKQVFDYVGDFSCDLAYVRRDGKCGYVDRRGEVVIPLAFDDAGSFSPNGFANVRKGGDGFTIDTQGRVVAQP